MGIEILQRLLIQDTKKVGKRQWCCLETENWDFLSFLVAIRLFLHLKWFEIKEDVLTMSLNVNDLRDRFSLNIINQDICGYLAIMFVQCFLYWLPWQLHAVKPEMHPESTDLHQAYALWSKPLGVGRSKVTVPVEPGRVCALAHGQHFLKFISFKSIHNSEFLC